MPLVAFNFKTYSIFQIFLNILFFPAKTLPDLTLDSLQSIVDGLG